MIPEITITCSTGKVFINNITVEQYKKYAALMEKNGSDKITDALFSTKELFKRYSETGCLSMNWVRWMSLNF